MKPLTVPADKLETVIVPADEPEIEIEIPTDEPVIEEPKFSIPQPPPWGARLCLSKSGIPCLWEEGGGMTNTGKAIVIAGINGDPLHPIYIRRAGDLSCSWHALVPVKVGCHIITASHHRCDFTTRICRIVKIDLAEKNAELETVNEFSNGEWDNVPDPRLAAAVEAAEDKATCYHCREPHYVKKEM